MTGTLTAVGFVALSIVGLWFGATLLVDAALRVARRAGLSDVVVGLTVVAIGTSLPEFSVSASAALAGNPDVAVANVVGSNVFNLGFILGTVALVGTVPTTPSLVHRDGPFLVATTLLLVVFIWDRSLGRLEGAVFVLALVAYVAYTVTRADPAEVEELTGDVAFRRVDLLRLLVGLVVVVAASTLLVTGATSLARAAGMPDWLIGVTVVAAGTSTPELVTALAAATRGREGVSAGTLLGSDVFNVCGALGLSALLAPLEVAATARLSVVWMAMVVALVVVMFWTDLTVSRREGALLVGLACVRWAIDAFGVAVV